MRRFVFFIIGAGLTLVIISLRPALTEAQTPDFEHPPLPRQEGGDDEEITVTGDNGYCALCHSRTDFSTTLADGSTLDLSVTPETLAASVHGTNSSQGALGCVDCHGDTGFPHDKAPASIRELKVASSQLCITCHTQEADPLADGVHAEGLARGNLRSATCVDCHGAHDVQSITEQPQAIAQTCGDCHTTIFTEFKDSVHGEALLVDNDPNVPTCTTCHGVHGGLEHPTTAQARNRSPQLCLDCHADEKLMKEYDISTNIENSYINDFHGTTVELFDQQDPATASNKAVCYDCHGVHNITPADDSKSQVAKENLLATCQQCHPNATNDFPDAWVGHFEPTAEKNPVLFGVTWFYRLLIPMVLGGFGVMVAADIFGTVRRRRQGDSHDHH